MLEMEEAGECVRLRKRKGTTLVAGLRVNETVGSFSRGGQGKSKDFPARDSLMSPDAEGWGGWGARRGGEEKKDSSNEMSEWKVPLLRSYDPPCSGSEGRTFEL